MARELILLRHGTAKPSDGGPDRDRRLKDAGKRQARKIGAWMRKSGLAPDGVFSSPARRAIDTAGTALKAAALSTGLIRADEALYGASRESVIAALPGYGMAGDRIMLVGHNPWIEDVARHLAGAPPETAGSALMTPGTLVRLSMPDDWSVLPAGCARILDYVRPEALPDA